MLPTMTERHTPSDEDERHGQESQRDTAEYCIAESKHSPAEYAVILLDEGMGRDRILLALVGLADMNDGESITALIEEYGNDAVEIITEVRRMGASHDMMRREVSLALPPDRETISLAPGDEDFDRQPSEPAPEPDNEPVESTPEPISQPMPQAKMFKADPEPNMGSQALLDILTDEGRAMLEILLAEDNIRDVKVLIRLEENYQKGGFVTLASCIVNEQGMRELIKISKAEKAEGVAKSPQKVKRGRKLGRALFGKPQKKQ
jgi:hypothetical protein